MKAIIFDVFGTLIEVEKGSSARTILAKISSHGTNVVCGTSVVCGASVDEDKFLAEWRAFYAHHTADGCAFMTEREIFTARIKMFYDRYGVDGSPEAEVDSLLSGAFLRKAYKDVIPALSALRGRYKILLGSNTDNDVLEAVIKRNGIRADGVFTSESLRCYKPAPRFFGSILERCSLSPREVIFVGDNPRDDVSGPKQLGIRTVLTDRSGSGGDFGQDYTISSLTELDGILRTEVRNDP